LSITKERRSKLSFLQKLSVEIIFKPCSTRHLTEEEIKQTFVKALNSLVEVKENVIAELTDLIDGVCQTGKLMEEHSRVEQELCVLAERLIGTSDAFEEAESLHLVLNRDLRDVESDALICGKISRRGRGNNSLHTLLTESLLPLCLLRSRLIELLLLRRSGDNRDGREGEEGDEE